MRPNLFLDDALLDALHDASCDALRNAGRGALHRLRRAVASRAAIALCACFGMVGAQAAIEGIVGTTSGGARSFDLFAADGYIMAADGQQIYMWGYGASTASGGTGLMQISGPTLKVQQGETVTVNFTNQLVTRSSIMFAGQTVSGASGGSVGVLAQEAAPGQTVSYTFTASQPGTYLYQSGTQPGLQVEMGLVGAIVVYPTGTGVPGSNATTKWAYNHAGTAYEREALLVVSEADSDIHAAVDDQLKARRQANDACLSAADGCVFAPDLSHRFPKYWFLNGRTSPDVFAKNAIGEMPHQPYNALPRLHPGERILLRMVGAGSDLHPMHHHGNNSWAIARDGRLLSTDPATRGPNLAFSDYTIKVVPGQTYDAIWSWSGAGIGWDIFGASCDTAQPVTPANCRFGKYTAAGVPIAGQGPASVPGAVPPRTYVSTQSPVTDMYRAMPVKIASEFELAHGEFYSGSPYLGEFGVRPVGTGLANTTGAFFHMFHSHNEREIVNGGVYPGGMMTMLVIEPFGIAID